MSSDGEMLYGMVKPGLMRPYLLPRGSLGAWGISWVLELFLGGTLSLLPSLHYPDPHSPPQALLGSAELISSAQPGVFTLASPHTSPCFQQNKTCLNPVCYHTLQCKNHILCYKVSVFTFLCLPSWQPVLFCGSRMKMELVFIFQFILLFPPKHWDS